MKIIAKRDTFLSKETNKCSVKGGKYYFVDDLIIEGTNVKVVLSHNAGTWYIDPKDWKGLPAVATPSEIPNPTKIRGAGGSVNKVVYYSQRDNYRDRDRSCFSSTCAMLLKFYDPTAITNDDEYLRRVLEYGDTTDANAQLKALISYGLNPEFSQTKNIEWLQDKVSGKYGEPVAFGWLHHGPKELPGGGGHWSLCYSYDYSTDEFLVHDPWRSEYDHKNGLYRGNAPGEAQRFSLKHMQTRWTVESAASGWCLYVP